MAASLIGLVVGPLIGAFLLVAVTLGFVAAERFP